MCIRSPDGINANSSLTVYGAGTLVFDQYGQVKYYVARLMKDHAWQRRRLEYLFAEVPDDAEIGNAFPICTECGQVLPCRRCVATATMLLEKV